MRRSSDVLHGTFSVNWERVEPLSSLIMWIFCRVPTRRREAAEVFLKYLPHVWILKDPHYSLDPVHGDALLKTAETCRRTKREESAVRRGDPAMTSSDLPFDASWVTTSTFLFESSLRPLNWLWTQTKRPTGAPGWTSCCDAQRGFAAQSSMCYFITQTTEAVTSNHFQRNNFVEI